MVVLLAMNAQFLQVIVKRLLLTIRLQSWGLIGCIHNEIYGNSTTETSASFEGNSETSSKSTPSDQNSTLTFSRCSQSCSGDGVTPMASNIKGHIIRVIHDIKGRGWSGSMGNAGQWPWSWTSIV